MEDLFAPLIGVGARHQRDQENTSALPPSTPEFCIMARGSGMLCPSFVLWSPSPSPAPKRHIAEICVKAIMLGAFPTGEGPPPPTLKWITACLFSSKLLIIQHQILSYADPFWIPIQVGSIVCQPGEPFFPL